tara:strand:- start:378 stop:944 length:567 start_codon:yes stop_codon:yes gene_type:complete
MILNQLLVKNFYIKVYYIMNTQLQLWRNSFTLVPNNASVPGACKKGKTFRGGVARNASVEFGQNSTNCPDLSGTLTNMNKLGTAKPGPTAIRDSSLVRRKRIQVRTKSIKPQNPLTMDGKFNRTFRGDNAHVENSRDGFTLGSRSQLFGVVSNNRNQEGLPVKGVRGDSSDVIYFKPIFERFSLNVKN